jgi:hypothetical protein
MKKKAKLRTYEPPQARDLSGSGATGIDPKGACKSGNYPYFNCVAGPTYNPGPCVAGATVDTSACTLGGYHTQSSCNFGAVAATVCISGAHQQ